MLYTSVENILNIFLPEVKFPDKISCSLEELLKFYHFMFYNFLQFSFCGYGNTYTFVFAFTLYAFLKT